MKTASNTECHKYRSIVNMKMAVASFVDDSSCSVNQYQYQRHYFILSNSKILRLEVGKASNMSKSSVMHSFEFQLTHVLVIRHGKKLF